MLLEEYDEEKVKRYLRKEAIEEGLEEGRKRGIEQGMKQGLEQGRKQGMEQGLKQGEQRGTIKTLVQLVKNGSLDLSAAAAYAELSVEEFKKLLS